MNLLKSLTIRSLKLNKKRTVVTIIGVILSCTMIFGVAAIASSFQDLFIQSAIQTDGNYHATFYQVSSENTKYISAHNYTEKTMFSRDLGYAYLDGSKDENKPYLFVKEYDGIAFENMPVTLKEGRFPAIAGEIVISEEILSRGGVEYQVGQTINLDIGNRTNNGENLGQSNTYYEEEVLEPFTTGSYTITGVITKPLFESYNNPGFTAIAYLDQSSLNETDLINVSILARNPKKIFELVPDIAATVGADTVSYNNELLRWMGISRNVNFNNTFQGIALIIILLVVVGSVTVIYNAFAISVSERKKQFGLLASVGATPGQIRRAVFFEGIIIGVLGLPLGILFGALGIGITLKIVNNLLVEAMYAENIALKMVIAPWVIVVTVFFVGMVIFLSAFLPARRAAKISPIDAIRLNTDIKIKGKAIKTSRISRFFFGIEGELALKNLKRNRKRYRATVFSLFISILLFISFSSFMTYGFMGSNLYYGETLHDIEVGTYDLSPEEKENFFSRVAAFEGVERYAEVREMFAYVQGMEKSQFGPYLQDYIDLDPLFKNEQGEYRGNFVLMTLGEAEFENYIEENNLNIEDYQDTTKIRGILINKNAAYNGKKFSEYEPMNMKKGEKLLLTDQQYDEEGNEVNPFSFALEIGAVTDSLPFGLPNQSMWLVRIVISDAAYEAIKPNLHEISQDNANDTTLFIKSDNNEKVAEKIREMVPRHNAYVNDIRAQREDINRMKIIISIFLYGFLSLITLIGVTNIFNTISTNVALRRREFAMLKSVGMTPKGFNKMINYESIFYGLKALLYGMPAGIIVSYLMFKTIGNVLEFAFILPWKEIFICIAGVFVIVFITMMHASSKLKKEDIIAALKMENL